MLTLIAIAYVVVSKLLADRKYLINMYLVIITHEVLWTCKRIQGISWATRIKEHGIALK